ncbi:MAG: sulfatase-like hydrolase/transferase, partial [Candidatus Omnitrophica bacterium]|nr:sulfatase-like hydrolase/transferase [Candidatus Omnitrophota bacterium]
DKMVEGGLEKFMLKVFGYSKKWSDMVIPKFSRNADRVTASSVKWLKNRTGDKPFFMWLHYFDAHDHFRLPKPLHLYYYRRRDYKKSIEYIDKNLGKLVKYLKDKGQFDKTIFVVTSDHGEILNEYEYLGQKYRGHAPMAYELTLKVPLIFSGAGIKSDGMIKTTFRHIDLMPTIISLAGVDSNNYAHIEGEDLSGVLHGEGEKNGEPCIYAETIHPTTKGQPEWRVMIRGKWKFVLKPQAKEEILYDLENDPMEKTNVIMENGDIASELRDALLDVIRNDKVLKDESQNPEVRKALEALGYM